MAKKILIYFALLVLIFSFFPQFSLAISTGQIYEGEVSLGYRNVTVYAPAVATTDKGYIGVISTITVTIQNGSGRVFVDTLPLTQIDMQGSARLAVKVASTLVENDENCGVDPSDYDYFFVVRTSAPIIGGPSAGAIMTVATIALLENWTIDDKTVMTGMINPDGGIGPIGGIIQKLEAAYSVGATRFLIPKGQGTYIEMITETIVENGRRRTVSTPVTRNVAEYGIENFGIEVVEVADVNEAVMNFTGFGFDVPVSDVQITTEDYVDSMKPLASTLLEEARMFYQNASSDVVNTTISNRHPTYYQNLIIDILNDAGDLLDESQNWYDQGLYYSSTSKSFQSLIDSRYVFYTCEYFNSGNSNEYIVSLLDDVTSFYESKSDEAENADINGMVSLQCVGAAQKRVSEAGSFLEDARDSYYNLDHLGALYKIAFAMERSRSVGWWLNIGAPFNDTGNVNITVLKNLAAEYIEDGRQAAVYSSVILQEIGKTSSYLDESEVLLAAAEEDFEKDFIAAALFNAFEALAKANLAIEIIDGITEDKIDRARERASNSISDSRNIGIEPVLAVSYYEYAQSLVNDSELDVAIGYYKYSGIIAGALGFTNFSIKGYSSRYVGIPKIDTRLWKRGIFEYFEYLVFFTLVGCLGGLGLGLIIGGLLFKKQKDSYDQWTPRSINDYYKKNK